MTYGLWWDFSVRAYMGPKHRSHERGDSGTLLFEVTARGASTRDLEIMACFARMDKHEIDRIEVFDYKTKKKLAEYHMGDSLPPFVNGYLAGLPGDTF